MAQKFNFTSSLDCELIKCAKTSIGKSDKFIRNVIKNQVGATGWIGNKRKETRLQSESVVWIYLFPLLEHEIAAAPRRGHRVSRISIIINAVQLRRRRSPEDGTLRGFLVLTSQILIKHAVGRFERLV